MGKSPVDLALLICLLVAGLAAGTTLPRMQAYLIVAGAYGAVLMTCFLRGTLAVRYERASLYPVVLLWIVFLVVFVLHPTGKATLRTGAFIVFSAVNLFLIPGTFSREQFVDGLSIVATGVAAFAIPVAYPSLVANRKGMGIWQLNSDLLGTDITTPVLTSIFSNPNYLAALSALGFIATFGFARTRRRRWIGVMFAVICLSGLLLSGGRAATLGLISAVVLYLVYRVGDIRATIFVITLGIIGSVCLFVLVLGNVPWIHLPTSFFNRRRGLWNAALSAVGDRPLLGWGLIDTPQILAAYGAPTPSGNTLGTHNSYLRMFLQTGIIGGASYLVLCASTLIGSVSATRNNVTVSGVLLSLLAAFFIFQFFNGSTIFGLSLISSFGALILGFSQYPDHRIEIPSLIR